jgi:hypothetical protein
MTSTTTPPVQPETSASAHEPRPAWRSLIVLAAVLLFVGGAVNLVSGLGLLTGSGGLDLATWLGLLTGSEALTAETSAFVDDPVAWGWFLLLIGGAKVAAGIGLLARHVWGAMLGIVFASLHLLAHMALLPSYPLVLTLLIVLDAVVIWVLVAHAWQDH